jgi:very-short-patch-repair endonuclease
MRSWRSRPGEESQRDFARANARKERQRRELTPSEKIMWRGLRLLNREGAKFRRQPAAGPWTFDFGFLSARVLIELDGGVHEAIVDVAVRDEAKARWAEANGYRLLRVTNRELWDLRSTVIERVRAAISAPHPLPPLHEGEGEALALRATEPEGSTS